MFGMKKKPHPGWSCSRCGGLNVVEAKWHHGSGIACCVTSALAALSYVKDLCLDNGTASGTLAVLMEAQANLTAAIQRTDDLIEDEEND